MPKQLQDLGGRSVLARSLAAFDEVPDVAAVVVVLPAELVDSGAELAGRRSTRDAFVAGGETRQESVRRGVEALPATVDFVLVHDAARPFVDAGLVERVLDGARRTGAAVPVIPPHDTVKRVETGRAIVAETLAREELWLAQTPQGFSRAVLEAAVALGAGGVIGTDEATLAERAGHTVEIVPGDVRNRKITTAHDLVAAQAMFAAPPRVGQGYDLHRLVDARPLVLAGVTIPFDRGPAGHSDGDVVCHALVDAMLGAAGAGDIGQHFPDTDARWKDAPGLDLLARANRVIESAGWHVSSADVTVILERPKLVPHLPAVRAAIAVTLGIDLSSVSVKGKTNEGVDAVGRGEAIAAHAVAVIVQGARR
jgi:2-C-methyl-D-erythritol 4-phosphate cytidylyltransferase/2-C-methyl-D-erythritol 2,4-cyclodiphosphate synthase